MVRAVWQAAGLNLLPVVRSGPVPTGGLLWEPGMPVPAVERVAAVVALWGVTPGPDRDLSLNTQLAKEAMALGDALGAAAVLHCSSGAVYRPGPDPVSEDATPDPQSAYGRAKLDMERAIFADGRAGGPRQVVMRIGNVAGADSLFGNLARGCRITLDRFPEGDAPARSYIGPRDLCRVVEALIRDDDAQGVFNVALPVPTGMADIAREYGSDFDWRPAPPDAFRLMCLDTTRLSRIVQLDAENAAPDKLLAAARETGAWP